MITSAIFYILYGSFSLLLYPIKILPDASLPAGLTNSISTASDYLAGINMLLPINTLLTIFGLFLAIELSIFIYKLIMWAIKKIPTIN